MPNADKAARPYCALQSSKGSLGAVLTEQCCCPSVPLHSGHHTESHPFTAPMVPGYPAFTSLIYQIWWQSSRTGPLTILTSPRKDPQVLKQQSLCGSWLALEFSTPPTPHLQEGLETEFTYVTNGQLQLTHMTKPQMKPETSRLGGFQVGNYALGGWHTLMPLGQKLLHLPPCPPTVPPPRSCCPAHLFTGLLFIFSKKMVTEMDGMWGWWEGGPRGRYVYIPPLPLWLRW